VVTESQDCSKPSHVSDDWDKSWHAWGQRRAEETAQRRSSKPGDLPKAKFSRTRLERRAILLDDQGIAVAAVLTRLAKTTDPDGGVKWGGRILPLENEEKGSIARTRSSNESFTLLFPDGIEATVIIKRHRSAARRSTAAGGVMSPESAAVIGKGAAPF
jgi:hypothetical protein